MEYGQLGPASCKPSLNGSVAMEHSATTGRGKVVSSVGVTGCISPPPPQKKNVAVLTPHTSECALIRRQGLYRGYQVKMRSLGQVPIQYD